MPGKLKNSHAKRAEKEVGWESRVEGGWRDKSPGWKNQPAGKSREGGGG